MKDFILAALPFVVIGLCIAVLAAKHFGKNKDEETQNYMAEGLSIGMSLGVAFSAALKLDLGLGISMGMLIGETVGMLIQKKN